MGLIVQFGCSQEEKKKNLKVTNSWLQSIILYSDIAERFLS